MAILEMKYRNRYFARISEVECEKQDNFHLEDHPRAVAAMAYPGLLLSVDFLIAFYVPFFFTVCYQQLNLIIDNYVKTMVCYIGIDQFKLS